MGRPALCHCRRARSYDMQSCGEFVLVETSSGSDPNPVIVQTRTALYGPNVSVNTAVATLVDGHRATINTYANEPLRIDGSEPSLSPGESTALGAGQIHFDGSVYSITYPSSEHLIVSDRGSYIDVRFCASADRRTDRCAVFSAIFDGNAAKIAQRATAPSCRRIRPSSSCTAAMPTAGGSRRRSHSSITLPAKQPAVLAAPVARCRRPASPPCRLTRWPQRLPCLTLPASPTRHCAKPRSLTTS